MTDEQTNDGATEPAPTPSAAPVATVRAPRTQAERKPRAPRTTVATRADAEADAGDALTKRFLKLSGLKAEQIEASNAERRTFVCSNGGKYALSADGQQVIRLAGPIVGGVVVPADEQGEEGED